MAIRVPIISEFNPKGINDAQRSMQKFASKANIDLGKATLIIGAMGTAAYKAFQELDAGFDAISTSTGATGKALQRLKDDALAVFKTVPDSFERVGTAVGDFNTRLGLTGKELREATKAAVDLSRITDTDLQGNIRAVSRVIGDWGLDAGQAASTLDLLFTASQNSGIEVQRLGELVVQFGAPMRQFGFSFEEAVAMMAEFEKQGVNTETVMAGLRQGLVRLARAGEDPAEAFKRIVAEIKNAGSTAAANKRAVEIFGARAGPDMAAAIREGRFELENFVSLLEDSEGRINQASEAARDFDDTLRILKNQALAALAPELEQTAEGLGKILDVANRLKLIDLAAEFRGWTNPLTAYDKALETVTSKVPKLEDFTGTIEELTAALEAKGFSAEQVTDIVNRLSASTVVATGATEDNTDATEDNADATTDAAKAEAAFKREVDRVKSSLEAQAAATDRARQATENKREAARRAADSSFNLRRAEDDLAESVATLDKRLADAGNNLRAVRQVLDSNTQSARDHADAVVAVRTEQAAANGVTLDNAQTQRIWNQTMLATARTLKGPAQDALIDYIAEVNGIPEHKATTIQVLTNELSFRRAEERRKLLEKPINVDIVYRGVGTGLDENGVPRNALSSGGFDSGRFTIFDEPADTSVAASSGGGTSSSSGRRVDPMEDYVRQQRERTRVQRTAFDSTRNVERATWKADDALEALTKTNANAEASERDKVKALREAEQAQIDLAHETAEAASVQQEAATGVAMTYEEKNALVVASLEKVAGGLDANSPLRANLQGYIGDLQSLAQWSAEAGAAAAALTAANEAETSAADSAKAAADAAKAEADRIRTQAQGVRDLQTLTRDLAEAQRTVDESLFYIGAANNDPKATARDRAQAVINAEKALVDMAETEVKKEAARRAANGLPALTEQEKAQMMADILSFQMQRLPANSPLRGNIMALVQGLYRVVGRSATGTVSARPGLHLVGEQGPELVAMAGGERVYNNRESRQMSSGSPPVVNNMTVNISAQMLEPTPAAAKALVNMIRDYERRNGSGWRS